MIASAPVIVFLLVAAADGNVDRKEVAAFAKGLEANLSGKSSIMAGALARAVLHLEELIQALAAESPVERAAMLVVALQLVERDAGVPRARIFARALYELGENVAQASGGFMGFGNKIGKEEQVVLDALKKLLNLD